jgi:hypothetical protein
MGGGGVSAVAERIWQASNTYVRTARKEWRCECRGWELHGIDEKDPTRSARCGATIAVGDRYLESTDSAPAFQSGDRYCLPCARHNGSIRPEQPWRHRFCRRSYIDQQRIDARTCECGGEPDTWYSEADL